MNNDILNELGTNFIEYAVAVNTDRAIPDAKSGLKPVAKRILWDAYINGYTSNKPHVKCAQIVGDTMGRFHPHGDLSIYEALVRLSRPWVMRYPLIDFHGSNGNISGDDAAAYRYTECRLSKISEDGMFAGIKKKNIDYNLNYNENEEEPCTLPAIFPNLLCNPNSGIGVAMACGWLPHNLNEVAQAIYDYMDGKEPIIKGPDFPTGGLVINEKELPAIISAGRGTVKVRGQYKVNKNIITFYEVPYGENIEGILKSIDEACEEKEIEGIIDIRDDTDKKGVKITIECAKNSNVENVIKLLFAKTRLQSSISYNQVALINKKPEVLGLKDCIKIYIAHNIDCLKRELNFDLIKYKDRVHIIDGLLIALEDIDNVIKLIKQSENSASAQTALMTKYNLDEAQAKAILAMRLSSLAKLEKIELENEKKELVDKINHINEVLASEKLQIQVVRQRLNALVIKYGDKRRTELTQIDIPVESKGKEAIIPEDVVVIVSQTGDVKRVPTSAFKVQKRNGKGIKSEDDAILTTISTNTVDYLLVFTDKGKMYKVLVDKLPVGTNTAKGLKFNSILQMEPFEKVTAVISLSEESAVGEFAVFITKKGLVKKTKLEEYTSVKRTTGIAAIKLKEGDEIKNVMFLNKEPLLIITKKGMSIKFDTASIGAIGRVTTGVKGISLDDGDEVLTALAVDDNDMVALVTENGYARKNLASQYPIQGRGGRGVLAYKPSETTGNLVSAIIITDKDNVAVIGKPNSICVPATEIPDSSTRTCMGNPMIKNSKISSATVI